MKKPLLAWCVAAMLLILCGCQGRGMTGAAGVGGQVVTGISVTCQTCESFERREYSAPEKLRLLLLAIRSLGPDFPARVDVEALAGRTVVLRLTCANGQQTLYTIKNNQYIRKNDGIWRQISLEKAGGFWQMILELPPDAPGTGVWAPLPVTPAQRVYFPALRRIFGR